jgi:hypothetical protein
MAAAGQMSAETFLAGFAAAQQATQVSQYKLLTFGLLVLYY